MFYYHIKNLMQFGVADYKGLDINKNIAGSQVYFDNECLLSNTESVEITNSDITLITEEEYNQILELQQSVEPNELEELKVQLKTTQIAVDFLLMMGGM